MLRLTIHHGTTQEGAEIIPTARYTLRDHRDPDINFDILENRMWGLRLSELARIWFLLHRTGDEPDTNAEILNAYEGTDATLKDLLPFRGQPSCFKYQNVNPLVVAALDERVKRACAMIVEDSIYDAYLTAIARNEVFFALNDPTAAPSGKPLPNVSPEIRKKATDRG